MEMTQEDRVALVSMTQHQGWPVFIRLAGEMIDSAHLDIVASVTKGSSIPMQEPPYYAGFIDALNQLAGRIAQATEELKAAAEELDEQRRTSLPDRSESVTGGDTAL